MKRLHVTSVVAAALSCAVLCGFAPSAMAQETSTESRAEQLAAIFPGTTKEQMLESARAEAREQGVSTDVMLEMAWKQVMDNSDQIAQLTGKSTGERSSSSGNATIPIGSARHKGDIFWSPQAPAQHVGIFVTTNDVVDAQGGSHNSGRRSHNSVKVARGGGLLEVKTTQAKRDKAANKALSYVGRPYNYDFAFNKNEGSKMNCSQLVWAAYNYGAGIDLSSGWAAPAVYPWDIKNSGWTSFYRQY